MKQLIQEILKVDRKSNSKVAEISPLQDYQEFPPGYSMSPESL